MIRTFVNLAKSAAAVAVAPAAIVADLLTLPSSAYDGRPAFGRTAGLMQAAGRAAHAAIEPQAERTEGGGTP